MLANQFSESGWLTRAICKPSPNFNNRPADSLVNLLVIHNISLPPGIFGSHYIEDLFLNQLSPDAHPYFRNIYRLRVSSHFLIRRAGELIQFVSILDRAWHAGQSQWQGKTDCNDFSVGIELEGSDDQPYTLHQYRALAVLTMELMARFPLLTADRIVGHSDVAPQRKTDPGPAFNWCHYKNLLVDGSENQISQKKEK